MVVIVKEGGGVEQGGGGVERGWSSSLKKVVGLNKVVVVVKRGGGGVERGGGVKPLKYNLKRTINKI
jgi:hypothetical protein